MKFFRLWLLAALWFAPVAAHAGSEADLYCQTTTSSTGVPQFSPASSTNPCPVAAVVTPSGTQATSGAVGSYVDGWNQTLGTKGDAAWSGSGSGSEISIQKYIAGELAVGGASSNPLFTVPGSTSVNSGTPTQTTATCGTSSGTLLAASSASSFASFNLALTAANPVFLNFAGGTASTSTSGSSFALQPGQTVSWSLAAGYLPTSAVTCIASASTTVVEVYK